MKAGKASRTAEVVAAIRAAHRSYEKPVLFDDPFAIEMTSPPWRLACRSRFLYWLLAERCFGDLKGVRAHILARSRFAEERLFEAVSRGVRQYVVLAAGFDTFLLRRPAAWSELAIFEVDHPATQRVKIARLERLGTLPPVTFVPIDFERQTLGEALAQPPFSSELPTFCSWLGAIPYLSREAVFETFSGIAAVCAPGSEIVFDYGVSPERLDPALQRRAQRLLRFTARRGEPLRTFFDPEELMERLDAIGFSMIENLSPEVIDRRYFTGRADGLRPSPGGWIAHCRLREAMHPAH